jgi:hypothetical protein
VNVIGQQAGGFMPRTVEQFHATISDSRFFVVMAVAGAGAHFFLVKMQRFREFWHLGLRIVKLRPL